MLTPRTALFRLEIKKGNGEWFNWNSDNLFVVYGAVPVRSTTRLQYVFLKKTSTSSGSSLYAATHGLPGLMTGGNIPFKWS